MSQADWLVVGVYMVALIAMSVFVGRGQQGEDDYFVGGRSMSWWAVGLSTMASQTSAISFLSIPAFVAMRPGGGLTWLQYELAVPLAMIAVAILLLPLFRQLELISVYRYLELRFGRPARLLVSAVFLASRGLGTAVGLYASALVLSVAIGVPLWVTIVLMGVFTLIYDVIGGIKAVIYSDVVQTVLLVAGLLVCIFYAIDAAGGMAGVAAAVPVERLVALDPSLGLTGESETPFWAFLLGGFFLYMSYYGTDQAQVQRELSTATIEDTRRSLIFNGFARFPLTALYLILGLCLAGAYLSSEELRLAVPETQPDLLVPEFILHSLPAGVRGLLFSAIFAAAMSSLDSSLNSLSAITVRDFVELRRPLGLQQSIWWGRAMTAMWGIIVTGLAFVVGGISPTVIEAVNKIGSAFYGPVLAAFLIGVLSARATLAAVFGGVLAGVAVNIVLWVGFPSVFWMWWNLTGVLGTVGAAWLVMRFSRAEPAAAVLKFTLRGSGLLEPGNIWRPAYTWLVVYFLAMLGLLFGLNDFAAGAAGGVE